MVDITNGEGKDLSLVLFNLVTGQAALPGTIGGTGYRVRVAGAPGTVNSCIGHRALVGIKDQDGDVGLPFVVGFFIA